MNDLLKKMGKQVKRTILSNPVEIMISLFCCVISCLLFENVISGWGSMAYYLPVLFIFSYTLNQYASNKLVQKLYFATLLLIIPFAWSKEPTYYSFYMVTLGTFAGIYFVSGWKRENIPFVESVLRFLRSLLFAGVLALVTLLILTSIFYSIKYIFEIWENGNSRFFAYAGSFVFMVEFPMLFLSFHRDKSDKFISTKVTEILLNYVLSPALLVYSGILYIYLAKTAILWSLPKGNVALIIVFFSIALFALKGCIPLANKCPYSWLYNKASWIVLPPQIMFWVGTVYRINQYGFTADRVYLIVVGLVITLTAILFFSKKMGRYLFVVLMAVALFGVVTYIPGIMVSDIERISQERRGPEPKSAVKLNPFSTVVLQEQILTEGFKSVNLLYSNKYPETKAMYLLSQKDSLSLYTSENELIYQIDFKTLLSKQMKKASLTHTDTIPVSSYSTLLKIELDSALLVLSRLNLNHDSVYSISYVEGGLYLKKIII